MAGTFEGTTVIDRPIDEVFAFLAEGTNDPKFSPRVLEIARTTDGPPAGGTRFASTVKDAERDQASRRSVVSLPAPVRSAIDAANRGDTEAFLACFTPDGVVDDWGREFQGPAATSGWSDKGFIGVAVSRMTIRA